MVFNIPDMSLTTSNSLIIETNKVKGDEILVDYIAQSDEQQEIELPTGQTFIWPHIGGRVVAWRNKEGTICLNMMPPDNVKAIQETHSKQEIYSELKDEDFD